MPRAARTRLRKPGSASLAAASPSLCTVSIISHKEPQQVCQHALMSLQPRHNTFYDELLRCLFRVPQHCMDKREIGTKLPLPIAAHVKSFKGFQVSHFWADLLDHRYLHGRQVLIWQKTWQRTQFTLAMHRCHGISAMPLHYSFPVCTDIRCARAVPVIALLQASCQCLRWRTCLARSRLSYSSSMRLCCSTCTLRGDDGTDATERLGSMPPTWLTEASFNECSEKHARHHEGSILRIGH